MTNYCPMLKNWITMDANMDGEPCKAVIPLLGCRLCKDFEACTELVRDTYRMEQWIKKWQEALLELRAWY